MRRPPIHPRCDLESATKAPPHTLRTWARRARCEYVRLARSQICTSAGRRPHGRRGCRNGTARGPHKTVPALVASSSCERHFPAVVAAVRRRLKAVRRRLNLHAHKPIAEVRDQVVVGVSKSGLQTIAPALDSQFIADSSPASPCLLGVHANCMRGIILARSDIKALQIGTRGARRRRPPVARQPTPRSQARSSPRRRGRPPRSLAGRGRRRHSRRRLPTGVGHGSAAVRDDPATPGTIRKRMPGAERRSARRRRADAAPRAAPRASSACGSRSGGSARG